EDGSGLRMVRSAKDYAGLTMQAAPDGHGVLYVRWTSDEKGGLHLVDVDTGIDRRVPVPDVASDVENSNQAWISPDGRTILFDCTGVTESRWAVASIDGGPARLIGPAWPEDTSGMEVAFSPDGASILASYRRPDGTFEFRILDPTGQRPDQVV